MGTDYNSLRAVVGPAKEIMVYGYADAGYNGVSISFEKDTRSEDCPIKKLYDYNIGNATYEFASPSAKKLVENKLTQPNGRKIEQIKLNYNQSSDPAKKTNRLEEVCKSALANIVLENFKRNELGDPLVPVLFLVKSDRMKEAYDTPENVTLRTGENYITNREIRRCYKLCTPNEILKDIENPTPEMELLAVKLADTAKETFKFAEVAVMPKQKTFSAKLAAWEQEGWDEKWNERRTNKPQSEEKQDPWNVQLLKLAQIQQVKYLSDSAESSGTE